MGYNGAFHIMPKNLRSWFFGDGMSESSKNSKIIVFNTWQPTGHGENELWPRQCQV